MKKIILLIGFVIVSHIVFGQSASVFRFINISDSSAVPAVSVSEKNKTIGVADESGFLKINLSIGLHTLIFSSTGFNAVTNKINIPSADTIIITMSPILESLDQVIVSSTRNNQRIENSPLKVEVLGREEMDEENTIKPGNIASILGDVSGIQIQQSSATSGNANVRIQGLDGKYTQILRDGMPLYDGFSGGFGILSIPPLDLKQIELIKGSASTLYGGGAIGGLINIISRKPTTKQEGVFTINQTTLKETNLNTFLSKRNNHFGYTFFGGYTHQKDVDVNKDVFSDLPKINAIVVHPRLFFYPSSKTTITAGYTGTFEKRKGGDMVVLNSKPDQIHQYYEDNNSTRHSGEFVVENDLGNNRKLSFKSSLSSFDRSISTNSHFFKGNQTDYFNELSLLVPYKENSFVAGVNVTGNKFKKLPSDPVLLNDFSNNTIGVFVQNTWTVRENTTFELGLRDDYTKHYGNFLLPRLALFHRFNEHWGGRLGAGWGYKVPDPLAPQIMDYAIEDILPLPAKIKPEKSVGLNIEGNYKMTWENGNEFFINHAFFLTQINHPVISTLVNGGAYMSFNNADKPIITKGFDTYIQSIIHEWEVYCGFTYTIAERKYLQQNQFVPLTPRYRAAFTLVRDFDAPGFRIGLEGSYNGPQYRLNNSLTPGYFFLAAMVEKRFGEKFSIVLNGENLLDYRQSKIEPLYLGSITNPQFVPLWAPIDGRVINLSLRIKPF
ncbi:MAG TPA: TonB-dependent receptor [Niabella sp.]|nr:TonB-dependent receptor [Niabella sp.]